MLVSVGQHEVHLKDYLYILRKRIKVILFVFFAAFMAGLFFTTRESVLFQATAKILIERDNPNIVDFKEVMSFDAGSTDYYQTQYLMITSQTLVAELIKKENLEEDPFVAGMRRGFLRQILKEQPFLPDWLKQFIVEPSLMDLVIKRMIDVEPIKNSRLVAVNVLHANPERAAAIANTLVDLFIQKKLKSRFDMATQATELIASQLEELKVKVVVAERALQSYKEKHNLVSIPSIHEVNEFLDDAKLELFKIQAEESRLSQRYLPAHPKMIHLRSEIEGLETRIKEEEVKTMSLSRVAVDYSQLEREAISAREVYQALLSRLQETTSEAKTQASNVIVVDHAFPPPRPFKPRPLLNMLIASFLGIVGGIGFAFFLEYFNQTIKIPDDVDKGTGLELFGIIPVLTKHRGGALKGEVFFDLDKPSPASEAFRALRTSLLFRLRHFDGCRVILVTSPNPGEGKSTLSLNLAVALQQNNLKVLLVDGDLRMCSLTKRVLGERAHEGLTDVLEKGHSPIDAMVSDVEGLSCDFLAGGSPSNRATEILGSHEMKDLMAKLRKEYDIVLFDCPPYLAVADVVVLSDYADAMLIAAQYHKTDKRHLKQVARKFSNLENKVVGVVLNQVNVKAKDYHYQQYYYYNYGEKKGR